MMRSTGSKNSQSGLLIPAIALPPPGELPSAQRGSTACRRRRQAASMRLFPAELCQPPARWHPACSIRRRTRDWFARMLGLVLTAGGARGAYQAGVSSGSARPRLSPRPSPFAIIAGASAGAINGAMIAAASADLRAGTQRLAQLWSDLSRAATCSAPTRSRSAAAGVRWLRDLALGGLIGGGTVQSLLDAAPLRALLAAHLPLDGHRRGDPRRPPLRGRGLGDQLPLGQVVHLHPGRARAIRCG